VPTGGSTNQILYKTSATDYATSWSAVSAAMLASGAAASNVGALGGALSGTLPSPSLASGTALGNLAQGDIAKVLGSLQITTDVWNNVALAAGDNTITGAVKSITLPEGTDLVLVNVSCSAVLINPPVATHCAWRLFVDGGKYASGPRIYCPMSTTTDVAFSGTLLIAGPGSANSALAAGAHNVELRFYTYSAIGSGAYLMPASLPDLYQYLLEVWVLRR